MTKNQSNLLALWAACKVRAVVWRAQALLNAVSRVETATKRPPVKRAAKKSAGKR
jgi:hypothetical protein